MLKLRIAQAADVPGILGIYRYYVENTSITFEYDTPTEEAFLTRFERITSQFPYLVAEEDGRIAGYCYAAPAFERAAYQWDADISVYIHEDYQRRGIARALYLAMHELLALQGYYTVYALITGSNERSLAFHKALGYREVGRLPKSGFKFGAWQDVYWMEHELRAREGEPLPPKPFHALCAETVENILRAAGDFLRD